jgi:hypothetical protein
MHCTLIMEDILLTAHRLAVVPEKEMRELPKEEQSTNPCELWNVHIIDKFTQTEWHGRWTDSQFGAISALMHGMGEDNDSPAHFIEYLYEIAESAIKGIPPECRPIP